MDETNKTVKDYLKKPYSRVLMPDDETGTFAAKIAEFAGCFAQGDTAEEAYRNLDAAAESWIEEVLHAGQEVPEPAVDNQYSGRVALRLPKSLHRNAAQLAERDGTSLNQFLATAIAEKVGAGNLYGHMSQSLEHQLAQTAAQSAQEAFNNMVIDIVSIGGWGTGSGPSHTPPNGARTPAMIGGTPTLTIWSELESG